MATVSRTLVNSAKKILEKLPKAEPHNTVRDQGRIIIIHTCTSLGRWNFQSNLWIVSNNVGMVKIKCYNNILNSELTDCSFSLFVCVLELNMFV